MSPGVGSVRVLSCGIFREEYQLLPEALRLSLNPVFLDSMLHMNPEKLDELLATFLQKYSQKPALILFGDCCPHMQELGDATGVSRTRGVNCCEIYLGHERYRQLRKERTFFLMPEWAKRWERVVKNELGLMNKELARDFMAQSMSRAVYIDTGVLPVPEDELKAFGEYTGLEVEVVATGPEHFIAAMQAAFLQLESQGAPAIRAEDQPPVQNDAGDLIRG